MAGSTVGKGRTKRRLVTKPSGRKRPTARELRAKYAATFGPLLEQVEAAHDSGTYSFFACVDQLTRTNGKAATRVPPVVLVANDYLGLSMEPRVREAAVRAIADLGTSRCASPLAGGQTTLHRSLEQDLADFLQQDEAALFASGYQANVGVISALAGRGDLVLTDLYDHASIVDGARLSGAEVRFFQHNSPAHLRAILEREARNRRVLVIVEGVYSVDGDIAKLPEIVEISHRHGALVLVDEAHSLGVVGDGGRGAAEHFNLLDQVDVIIGTMSKSLASIGGFVAADAALINIIRHSARALIFSAAPPPASVAAAQASLAVLRSEPQRRERLWHNATRMLRGLKRLGVNTMASVTPVIPVLVGDPARTLIFTARLREEGVLVCPAVPPMVQGHMSRIRGHVTALHTDDRIDFAIDRIGAVARDLGLIGRPRPTTVTARTATPAASGPRRAAL